MDGYHGGKEGNQLPAGAIGVSQENGWVKVRNMKVTYMV